MDGLPTGGQPLAAVHAIKPKQSKLVRGSSVPMRPPPFHIGADGVAHRIPHRRRQRSPQRYSLTAKGDKPATESLAGARNIADEIIRGLRDIWACQRTSEGGKRQRTSGPATSEESKRQRTSKATKPPAMQAVARSSSGSNPAAICTADGAPSGHDSAAAIGARHLGPPLSGQRHHGVSPTRLQKQLESFCKREQLPSGSWELLTAEQLESFLECYMPEWTAPVGANVKAPPDFSK